MSSNNLSGNVVSVDEQAFEQAADPASGDEAVPVVDDTPEFRASVDQEIQAKVDANHPDAASEVRELSGVTLAQEERIRAREAELDRISARGSLTEQRGREGRSRERAAAIQSEARREFDERAASVDPWQAPERDDPREALTREELAAVNEQAARIAADDYADCTRAAVARRLAERVADGDELLSAVVAVKEAVRQEPGTVVPIGDLEAVAREEVSIRGRIETLWEPSSAAIRQVGLIADESGRTKFTSWVKSRAPLVEEGDEVVLRAVAKNWYQGRCSVALTGRSRVEFSELG
jgi:hypothetical protein